MKRWSVVVLAVSLFLSAALAGPAFAGPIIGDTTSVRYSSAGPPHQIASTSRGNVYTGPYGLTVPADDALVSYWMCFNAFPTVSSSPWTALVADTDLARTVFAENGLNADKVNMIAWLANQWDSAHPTETNRAINLAMWEIMADYGTASGLNVGNGLFKTTTAVDLVNDYLTDALGALRSGAQAQALFLLPGYEGEAGTWILDRTKTQPFVQPVPEPGTLLLFGSGLLGLGARAWRRRALGTTA